MKEIEKRFHIEGDFEHLEKSAIVWKISKNVADFDKEGVVQLRTEKGKK